MANVLSAQKLLEAGAHFGHQTRRWNPKMKKYIYTAKKGVHIIDLSKTVKLMDNAYSFVKDTVAKGGSVIFVGTKKQAKEAIEQEAKRAGQFYMAERWLGGTLTNIKTVSKSIKRMIQIERMEKDGTFAQLPKKEVILLKKEHVKLEVTLRGIRNMMNLPKIMFVADPVLEQNAVKEAKKLGIKIVGIADTNCDPDQLDFIIPANDDANKSVALIAAAIADACIEAKGGTPLVAFTKDEPRQFPEGSGEERPRRDFNNDRPRRDFNNNGPRREFNNDRPRRDFNNNGPKREFNNDRPTAPAKAPVATPAAAPVAAPVAAPAKAATNFEAMTLADLKKLAKEKGLSGYSTLKKAEIVEMIKKA